MRSERCAVRLSSTPPRSPLVLLALALALAPAAAAAPATLVSSTPAAPSVTAGGQATAMSDDGRWVVFVATGSEHLPGYSGSGDQVWLADTDTGEVELVTRAGSPSTGANGISSDPVISADGAYVAFLSTATNLAGASGPANANVYVWERASGAVTLASHVAGSPLQRGFGVAQRPSIDATGDHVVFASTGVDLVASEVGPASTNVYLWSRATNGNTLVSHSAGAPLQRANALSVSPRLSADGNWVVHESRATDLVAGSSGPTNVFNVHLWQRATDTTTLVSHAGSALAQRANAPSFLAAVRANADHVAFLSSADDLGVGTTGPGDLVQVYLWTRATGTVTLVSHAAAAPTQRSNGEADGGQVWISEGAVCVVYTSAASNVVAAQSGPAAYNAFAWKPSGGNVLVSHSAAGASQGGNGNSEARGVADDGDRVLFESGADDLVTGESGPQFDNAYFWDRASGEVVLVSRHHASPLTRGDERSFPARLSRDGTRALVNSAADDLVPADHVLGDGSLFIERLDSFLYDLQTAPPTATVVTRREATIAWTPVSGDADSQVEAVSPDGGWVAFTSAATDILAGAIGAVTRNVYLRELATGNLHLVSHTAGDALRRANESSGDQGVAVSDGGAFVAFTSRATDLTPAGSGPESGVNVYLWERATGSITLVSHVAGAPEERPFGFSVEPVIDRAGTRVVFRSDADAQLIAGLGGPPFAIPPYHVYAWERATGTLRLVSHAAGTPLVRADNDAYAAVLSDDGTYVAYVSSATDPVAGAGGPVGQNVYLWRAATDAATLVSHAGGSALQRAAGTSNDPSLDATAAFVGFTSDADDVVAGSVGHSGNNVYLWARGSNTTTLVSHRDNPLERGDDPSWDIVVSGDGSFAAFVSTAVHLVPGSSGPVTPSVYLWERLSGEITLLSHVAGSPQQRANGTSDRPAIDGTASCVAFLSDALDLLPGASGATQTDVYGWSAASDRATRLSNRADGLQRGNGSSSAPRAGRDRMVVAFSSNARDLVTRDFNRTLDAYAAVVPLFADGFEAADTSAWSAVVGGP